jgi:hypothetical protein
MWVVELCLELLPVFIVCLCGIFVYIFIYSGTAVIGYRDIVVVCDVLGFVSLTVGLMW